MTASVRGQLGIAALITVAGTAGAVETLPPLRVDPGLMGAGTPVAKQTPPTLESPAVAAVPAPTPVATTATPEPAPTPRPAKQAAKAGRKPEVADSAPVASNEAKSAAAPAAVTANLKERPVEAPVVQAASPAQVQAYKPPQVTEQPRVPPLYSAYERAGMLPEPGKYTDPKAAPIYIVADSIDGRTEQELVAQGNVELRKRDAVLNADHLTYWQLDDEAEAVGNVKLTRDDDVMRGTKMRLRLDESQGYLDQADYSIRREIKRKPPQNATALTQLPDMLPEASYKPQITTGVGKAEKVDFEGEGQYRLTNATYSTCPAGENQDWYAEVGGLKLDYDREVGTGDDVKLVFKDTPILYSPWLSFSLNNQRKSGLLPATVGANTRTGFQYTQPLYWNIAPNMDATLTSKAMTKRGVQMIGDVRYIDFNYSGSSRFEYLPNDNVTKTNRYAYAIVHNQNFGAGLTGNVNLNGVSDSNYFTDLSTRITQVSQGTLVRQGSLTYNAGWWSANLLAQSYQTLQDPLAPIVPPYSRLPQLSVAALRPDLPYGVNFGLNAEYVKFSHPTNVVGTRMVLYPQLSLPLQTSAFFITPKIGVHSTSYSLERQAAGVPNQITRNVPIASVDTGVTYEREANMLGKSLTQTLEPRLYYVYIPNRDQSNIPVFDSALADFNFAQIFAENRYGGSDRIGDANQLTAAVTSRLIDPNTGVELVRAMLGQRYYFTGQNVTLNTSTNPTAETARTSRSADLLASLSGLIMPKTYVDTGWQYNPRDGRTERLNLTTRYQPEIGKVLNAGYRYTRDLLGQIDISAQWPLRGGWSGVGRYNYSTKEKRLVEGVAGFEYSAGCWAVRGVLQQLATTAQTKTTSFFIQLELTGFSNIGSNPNEILKRNIPGYGRASQSGSDPIFGSDY